MNRKVLIDKYGRQLNYLRLSVTDRCNFRCYYCMPYEGVKFVSKKELLSIQELHLLSKIFCNLGVSKVRITGGEPFVRPGILSFLEALHELEGLNEISITTNATFPEHYIAVLKKAGIHQINISLDSLDPANFHAITRRDSFAKVYNTILNLVDEGFDVKLNCVVSYGKNEEEIIPFIKLTEHKNIAVRFLEEMPFNGSNGSITTNWNYQQILQHIREEYPSIEKLNDSPNSTSLNYKIPGYAGSFGVIPSFSRTFCGTCNRIRLSATGDLRTCLYGAPAINLRDVLRQGASEDEIADEILRAVASRSKDGFEAEAVSKQAVKKSMSVLGG